MDADLSSVLRTLSAFSNQQPQQSPPVNPDDDYEPPDAFPSSAHHAPRPSSTPTPLKDPSAITSWPPALQHVMRAMSQNDDLQRRIRRLIQRQHDHERQWWQGREALRAKQTARVQKKKELDEVLRSVGAPVDANQVSTAEDDQAELQHYDAKVYRASRHMADAMTAELRALQIPFFALRPDSAARAALSPEELAALQRRMLELLQDLCGGE
ncbi:hypothetical protein BDV59DRAFT_178124 [Aspergillus ambiguus]|uniref:uncharacterized protein n=1 Tax=Aspergillus ambiguus TaxID=176160 RepID=UPI003CCD12AD